MFYGEFTSPATIGVAQVFMYSAPIFLFDFNQIWNLETNNHKCLNIKFHGISSGMSRTRVCRRIGGRI